MIKEVDVGLVADPCFPHRLTKVVRSDKFSRSVEGIALFQHEHFGWIVRVAKEATALEAVSRTSRVVIVKYAPPRIAVFNFVAYKYLGNNGLTS